MGNGFEPITEEEELAAVRAQARRVVRNSVVATILSAIVVAVFLSIGRLGVTGALTCSTVALSLATVAQFFLRAATAPPEPAVA